MTRSKRLTVRITTDELNYLKRIARHYRINKSEAMRLLIRSEYEIITGKASNN